jgi:hypothetical protein
LEPKPYGKPYGSLGLVQEFRNRMGQQQLERRNRNRC